MTGVERYRKDRPYVLGPYLFGERNFKHKMFPEKRFSSWFMIRVEN